MGKSAAEPVVIDGAQLENYAANFRWADDKYPVSMPLREIVDEIQGVRILTPVLSRCAVEVRVAL